MPERRRAAAHRHDASRSAFIATCDVLAEPRQRSSPARIPSRHGVTLTLTDGDLFPDRRNVPDVAAHRGRGWRPAARCRAGGWLRAFARGAPAARPEERQRARAAAAAPHARDAAARARLPRRAQGQVAPDQAASTGDELERRRHASASSATTASPTGSRRTPAATPRPRLRRRQRRHTPARAGTRTTRARWSAWLARRTCPSRSAWSCSLVNPHDVLGYPSSYEAGGYARRRVPRPRRAAAADRRRGPARQADASRR